jgi:hypothetical protein
MYMAWSTNCKTHENNCEKYSTDLMLLFNTSNGFRAMTAGC